MDLHEDISAWGSETKNSPITTCAGSDLLWHKVSWDEYTFLSNVIGCGS